MTFRCEIMPFDCKTVDIELLAGYNPNFEYSDLQAQLMLQEIPYVVNYSPGFGVIMNLTVRKQDFNLCKLLFGETIREFEK